MELIPFKKITDVPNEKGTATFSGVSDVICGYELIDIIDIFKIDIVRGINKSYFRGVSAYMLESKILFSFNNKYKLDSVEFRLPLNNENKLFFNGVNLFQETLKDIRNEFMNSGILLNATDVGFDAPSLGVSFFSNEFDNDLLVPLDAVTVNFSF